MEKTIEREIEPDILKWSGSTREMGFRADPPKGINLMNDINQLIPIFREKKDITPHGGSEFCDLFWILRFGFWIFSYAGLERYFELFLPFTFPARQTEVPFLRVFMRCLPNVMR